MAVPGGGPAPVQFPGYGYGGEYHAAQPGAHAGDAHAHAVGRGPVAASAPPSSGPAAAGGRGSASGRAVSAGRRSAGAPSSGSGRQAESRSVVRACCRPRSRARLPRDGWLLRKFRDRVLFFRPLFLLRWLVVVAG
jgi:hypothetical protein